MPHIASYSCTKFSMHEHVSLTRRRLSHMPGSHRFFVEILIPNLLLKPVRISGKKVPDKDDQWSSTKGSTFVLKYVRILHLHRQEMHEEMGHNGSRGQPESVSG